MFSGKNRSPVDTIAISPSYSDADLSNRSNVSQVQITFVERSRRISSQLSPLLTYGNVLLLLYRFFCLSAFRIWTRGFRLFR